jgi:hypothetical protein
MAESDETTPSPGAGAREHVWTYQGYKMKPDDLQPRWRQQNQKAKKN